MLIVLEGLPVEPADWLSRLLEIMPVTGSLDIRCYYAAPWKIAYETSDAGMMRYHVVLRGTAILEDPDGGQPRRLNAGDIVILPGGDAHTLHDGSGLSAITAAHRSGGNHKISEITGSGDPLDMICGHLKVPRPHDRIMREYLPSQLIVNSNVASHAGNVSIVGEQLSKLISLMRMETDVVGLGGTAMLNAFSSALFTLSLRLASDAGASSKGLLAVAGNPRLAPALEAMMKQPGHPWTLPELAELCHVSRATFSRHFQEHLGKSASDFLLDLRMSVAANELKKPGSSTGAVAEKVGYQSEAAFQRIFKETMGVTPSHWRKSGSISAPS